MNKKTIWITGGSTRIGRALAIKFASKGWNVAVSARRVELLNELSNTYEKNRVGKRCRADTNAGFLDLVKFNDDKKRRIIGSSWTWNDRVYPQLSTASVAISR